MRRLLLVLTACLVSAPAFAQTTGGVNWLDANAYAKPQFVSINEPTDTTNEYWVDLGSGSGTTCSQASPCTADGVLGKAGTTGGPAIIHIKGTGQISYFGDTIFGSGNADCRTAACDNWILFTTWPAGSTGCATECTATITGNSNTNTANADHLIFDGGPNLKIRIESDGSNGIYGFHVMSPYTIFYRTQGFCSGTGEVIFSVSDTQAADHAYFINNEGYGCAGASLTQAEYLYHGPGTGGGSDDLIIQNNLLRDFGGDTIEINPRIAVTGVQIIGNVIYNGGNVSTFSGGGVNHRPCISISNQNGNADNGVVVANNLIWDCGSGAIWARASGTPAALYYNNTIYDYHNATDGTQPEGISSTSGACPEGAVRNNIIYDPEGTDPIGTGGCSNVDHNLCGTGKDCGTSSQVYSASTLVSTTVNDADYLTIGASSEAVDAGTTTGAPTVAATDYAGTTRDATYDIGAYEYAAGGGGGGSSGGHLGRWRIGIRR